MMFVPGRMWAHVGETDLAHAEAWAADGCGSACGQWDGESLGGLEVQDYLVEERMQLRNLITMKFKDLNSGHRSLIAMTCWWSFSFSILAFLSCVLGKPPKAEVPAEVPQALQYLGRGYNIITRDQHTVNDRDPGWKGPILEPTSLKDEWISDDGRCNCDAYTHEITGGKSAQESMMSEWDVKASVGLWKIIKASFTASSSFQTMNSQSFKQKQTFFDTKAACHLKTGELPGAPETIYFKYNFSEAFQNAVKSIPTDGANASVQWVMEHICSLMPSGHTSPPKSLRALPWESARG